VQQQEKRKKNAAMLQHSAVRKKNKALLRSLTKKKATGSCRRLLHGVALQRDSQLIVELHYSAAPSCSWSYAVTRF
jgi:ABC-type antimicrobial peptide transport system ATPase subunit